MKILLVRGEGDYGALDFENVFSGQTVDSLIARVEAGEMLEGEDGALDATVHEVGGLDYRFVDFVRSEIQDYDQSKHANFYVEGDTV